MSVVPMKKDRPDVKHEKVAPAKDVAAVEAPEKVQYVTITIPVVREPSGHASDRCDIASYMMRKHRLIGAFHCVREGFRCDMSTRNDGKPVESNSAAVIRIMELVALELRKNGISV